MSKVRVYELARELGVESKEVLAKLQEMGEFVRSASSTIEPPVARRLIDAMPAAPEGAAAKKTTKKAAKKTTKKTTAAASQDAAAEESEPSSATEAAAEAPSAGESPAPAAPPETPACHTARDASCHTARDATGKYAGSARCGSKAGPTSRKQPLRHQRQLCSTGRAASRQQPIQLWLGHGSSARRSRRAAP